MKQTVMSEHESETTREAILNAINTLKHKATPQQIIISLFRVPWYIVLKTILDMEDSREITRTASGAFVLGKHAPTAEPDLVLTSTDPEFAQSRLF